MYETTRVRDESSKIFLHFTREGRDFDKEILENDLTYTFTMQQEITVNTQEQDYISLCLSFH